MVLPNERRPEASTLQSKLVSVVVSAPRTDAILPILLTLNSRLRYVHYRVIFKRELCSR